MQPSEAASVDHRQAEMGRVDGPGHALARAEDSGTITWRLRQLAFQRA